MLTVRRRVKSPRSLSGTSAHPTMLTLLNTMVMYVWLTSFSFYVNRLSHSWDKAISDPDLEIPRSRGMIVVKGQVHIVSTVSEYIIRSISFHIDQTNSSWDTAISIFDLETSKVKNEGQGRIWYPASTWYTSFSFDINRTNHSWDLAKVVFDLEKHIRNC